MDTRGSRVETWIVAGVCALALLVAAPVMAQVPTPLPPTGPTLGFPAGIAIDGSALYVANGRNNTIVDIDLISHALTVLAGTPFKDGSADGTGSAARFNGPEGVVFVNGALYVVDSNNSTIRKITVPGGTVTTPLGSAGNSGPNDGIGSAAQFNNATQITTDGSYLYVADTGNDTLRRVDLSTMRVTTIGGQAGTAGDVDGPASKSQFSSPSGVATDGKTLYVADTGNDVIRKIDLSTDTASTVAGSGQQGSADGIGKAAQFDNPGALVLCNGVLYIMDADNHAVRTMNPATGAVKTVTQLNGHIGSGAAITSDCRTLYISDTTDNAIQAMDTTNGNVTQLYPPQ